MVVCFAINDSGDSGRKDGCDIIVSRGKGSWVKLRWTEIFIPMLYLDNNSTFTASKSFSHSWMKAEWEENWLGQLTLIISILLKFRVENKYNPNENPLAITENKNSNVPLLRKLSDQSQPPEAEMMICTCTCWRCCKSGLPKGVLYWAQ